LVTPGTDTITAADITNDLPWPTIGGSIIVQPPRRRTSRCQRQPL
jgi:hypothetical protein